MAAIRSLDRVRRNRAQSLLAESRERLSIIPSLNAASSAQQPLASREKPSTHHDQVAARPQAAATNRRQSNQQAPPPIAEVLRDVYEEEKKTA
jgi:hypothetical protein